MHSPTPEVYRRFMRAGAIARTGSGIEPEVMLPGKRTRLTSITPEPGEAFTVKRSVVHENLRQIKTLRSTRDTTVAKYRICFALMRSIKVALLLVQVNVKLSARRSEGNRAAPRYQNWFPLRIIFLRSNFIG